MPDLFEQPRCGWPADGHTPGTGPDNYRTCDAVVFADDDREYHRASSGPGIVLRVPFVCPDHEAVARRAGWKIVLWNMDTNRTRAYSARLPSPEPPDARATADNPIGLRAGQLDASHLGWVIRLEPHPPHQLISIQHRRDRGPGSAVTALFYENAPADVVGANRLVDVWPQPTESRRWRYEVHRVEDTPPGEEWWNWSIYCGPNDPDDLVLSGTAPEPPGKVIDEICRRHNQEITGA